MVGMRGEIWCKMDIEEIKKYFEFRKQGWPTGKDALDFAVTEIGEALDAWLRINKPEYSRNNDKNANIGNELGDALMMLSIASYELTGKSLDENLLEKWKSKGYNLKEIESDNFFFGANPHLPNEFLHDIYDGNSATIIDNPDLPHGGILKHKAW